MGEFPHHGKIDFATTLVAGHRQRAQRRTVITLPAADHLISLRLPDLHLVLTGKFKSGFDRFRTAAGKVDCSHPRKFLPANASNSAAYSSATGVVNWLLWTNSTCFA